METWFWPKIAQPCRSWTQCWVNFISLNESSLIKPSQADAPCARLSVPLCCGCELYTCFRLSLSECWLVPCCPWYSFSSSTSPALSSLCFTVNSCGLPEQLECKPQSCSLVDFHSSLFEGKCCGSAGFPPPTVVFHTCLGICTDLGRTNSL